MKKSEQMEVLSYGTEEIIPLEELEKKLETSGKKKKPLRVKLGLDPSAPDIHIGHAVVLRKLRQFQDLGHIAVLIVGDFTGTIGDPSGKTDKRKQLSEEEVKKNAETYVRQLLKILDEKKVEVVYNSEWLKGLTMTETLQLTSVYTVARMLERDDFALRYEQEKPISLLEFMYPLLQGYDSVAVRSDVELGGTDQKFNLLVGREIQKAYGQEQQVIITTPLLEGTDGVQKMSKSLGNYIGITDKPEDMYGKVMSISDELIVRYYRLAADLPKEEVDKIEKDLIKGLLHPKETKEKLAIEIVTIYYDKKTAFSAKEVFDNKHVHIRAETAKARASAKAALVETSKTFEVSESVIKNGKVWVVDLIRAADFASSNSDARRLIKQRAVKVNWNLIDSDKLEIEINSGDILQVGKRRIGKIKLK